MPTDVLAMGSDTQRYAIRTIRSPSGVVELSIHKIYDDGERRIIGLELAPLMVARLRKDLTDAD